MHIRVVRSSNREYAQLVESYRRERDGMPATRVIRGLGDPNSIEVQNLRVALEAGRKNKRVVMARTDSPKSPPQPLANLRYLDVAVLLQLWRRWELDSLLDELMPPGAAAVPASSVVAALCIQRCVDPGSKLYATQWLPRTALPLLLPLPVSGFNNTRVHRVLDELDAITARLMPRLVDKYASSKAGFATLFIDVTDTWFVGEGPTLAARAKTKEGMVARKVGIVLLCNQQGYPLRWEVIAGRESEVVAMSRMLALVGGLRWAQQTPLVCDRAMGRTAQIREMLATGLHFITALTRPEYEAYSHRIPHQALAPFEPRDDCHEQDIAEASRLIEAAGLQRVEDHLFVLDLGIVERSDSGPIEQTPPAAADDPLAKIMHLVRCVDEAVDGGSYPSQATAARAFGLTKQVLCRYRVLRRLPETVQQQILDGKARGRSLSQLIRIARLDDEAQQDQAFATLLASPPTKRASSWPLGIERDQPPTTTDPPIRVRAVVYFNPQLFVDQRRRARKRLQAIQRFAEDLNARLARSRSRMKRDQIAAAIDRRLRKDDLLEAFSPTITEEQIDGRTRYKVQLRVVDDVWSRRCRYHGFCVVVTHPEVDRPAAEICKLYRAKDAIEKDFQIIKSLVELRPVRHHTDAKVRAHVTVCMLSLLLQRTLGDMLTGLHSSRAALELLATTHLNRYAGSNGAAAHVVTRTDPSQNKILRRLRLQHLADFHETI